MTIQRKKTAKKRNPCLPCNPSTRATRFKRNPTQSSLSEKIMISDVIGERIGYIKGELDELYLKLDPEKKSLQSLKDINAELVRVLAIVQDL